MNRYLRVLAIVGGSLALLAIAGAVAVRFVLPPEKAGALLERQLESRLNREVELGAVRFRGLSTLRVDGIRISEAPKFEAGTFLTADAFEVTARLFPLLFRKLVVKSVLLDQPELTIIRSADGRFNVGGSTAAAPAGRAAGSAGVAPGDFLISDIRLRAGALTFVDKSTAALSVDLDPVNIHLSHVSLVSPVGVKGSASATFRGVRADLSFDAEIEPVKGDAVLTRFSVSAASASAQVTGRIRNAFGGAPAFNGAMTWTGLDPSRFASAFPMPEGLSVIGPTAGRLDVSGSAPAVDSRFAADFSSAALKYREIINKSPGVPFTAKMSLDRGRTGDLNLHDLVIRLASVELRGGGTLKGSSDTARVAAFRVETNEFEIADLFEHVRAYVPTGVTLAGPVRASASLEGWTGGGRFVADFDGTGLTAGFGDAFRKSPGTPLRLVADGRYATPLAVDFSSVRLDLDQLSMSGRGSYTTGKVRPTYVFRVKTNAFSLRSAAALLPAAQAYRPSGRAVMNMRVSRGAQGPLLAGEATLLSAGAVLQQASLTDLSGKLDFTNDAIVTSKMTGKLQGEPVQVKLNATRLRGRPLIEAHVRASKLDLAKLLPAGPQKTDLPRRFQWAPFPASVAHAAPGGTVDAAEPAASGFIFDTRGSLRAAELLHPQYMGRDVQLDWNLRSVTAGMESMTGFAKLRHGPGAAKNLRSLVEDSKAARLILGPVNLMQKVDAATGGALRIPSLENLQFTSMMGDYVITRGVVALRPMVIEAPGLSSRAEGTIGLAGAQPLDLQITVMAKSNLLEGPIGRALAALGNSHTIRMTMTGTVREPKVSVDQDALKRKVGDALENLFQRLSR